MPTFQEATYLVRGPDGAVRTIRAYSVSHALKIFRMRHGAQRGDTLNVKPRGRGSWETFEV